MTNKTGRNESTVLAFSRECMFEGVHLARVSLRKGENSAFHSHTTTRDTFFVMSGCLSIDVHVGTAMPRRLYRAVQVADAAEVIAVPGRVMHRIRLSPGDVCVIEPGVVHCAMNLLDETCHFLCIEGVGDYDFIEAAAVRPLAKEG